MSVPGFPGSAVVTRGAFIQLLEDFNIILPNIIPFQYNPVNITRQLTPAQQAEGDDAARTAQAPMVQPFRPNETFSLEIEFDATDDLEKADPLALAAGVAPKIAALRKLIEASEGLIGDLIASAQALAGNPQAQAVRPEVPVTLLVLGPGIILPIRITSFSVDMKELSPLLYPIMATVSLEMTVLTPEMFKCKSSPANDIAVAAYNVTMLQDDALAIANLASVAIGAVGKIPI
jgi:hypothetical protein